jgi:hypothetical protein
MTWASPSRRQEYSRSDARYLYLELTKMNIDIVGESQLIRDHTSPGDKPPVSKPQSGQKLELEANEVAVVADYGATSLLPDQDKSV